MKQPLQQHRFIVCDIGRSAKGVPEVIIGRFYDLDTPLAIKLPWCTLAAHKPQAGDVFMLTYQKRFLQPYSPNYLILRTVMKTEYWGNAEIIRSFNSTVTDYERIMCSVPVNRLAFYITITPYKETIP